MRSSALALSPAHQVQDMQGHYLDMEGADSLSFRLKGDGRKYMASVRVDNWIVGETSHDVWQAFLFVR